jgi:hypothetical protein
VKAPRFAYRKRPHVSNNEKGGDGIISENRSCNVGLTDLTSNPFIDGMKKIYELEPFINPSVIERKTPFPEPFSRKSRAI